MIQCLNDSVPCISPCSCWLQPIGRFSGKGRRKLCQHCRPTCWLKNRPTCWYGLPYHHNIWEVLACWRHLQMTEKEAAICLLLALLVEDEEKIRVLTQTASLNLLLISLKVLRKNYRNWKCFANMLARGSKPYQHINIAQIDKNVGQHFFVNNMLFIRPTSETVPTCWPTC